MTKKSCLILVVMLFFFQAVVMNVQAQEVSKKAMKFVEKGDKALAKQKLDDALENYDKALAEDANCALAIVGKAKVLVAQQKAAEAEAILAKALESNPENVDIRKFIADYYFNTAREAIQTNQFEAANNALEKWLAIPGIKEIVEQSKLTNVYFNVGMNYLKLKDLQKSTNFLEKFLEQPDSNLFDKKALMQITYQLGINFYQLKQVDKSQEFFIKLLAFPELQTEFPQFYTTAHYMLGLNYHLAKEHEKGIEYLKKFLEIAATDANSAQLLPLANMFIGISKMELLQAEVGKITGDKNEKEPIKKISELAKSQPDIETYLKKAIELKSDLEPAYMHLGNYYYYCNEIPKTIETYNTLVQTFPSSPDIEGYKKFLENIQKKK